MRSHPGQVSFPGGSIDPGRRRAEAAAARGGGGDRLRRRRGRGLRRAAGAVAAAEQLRGDPGARAGGARRARSAWSTRARCTRSTASRSTSCSTRPTGSPSAPERLDRPGLPDRPRARPHPVGLHGRHHRAALRLPGLDTALGRGRRIRDLPDYMLQGGPRPAAPNAVPTRGATVNLLDWVLVVLVLAYAVSGYWQGFVTGAFATTGLLLGGLAGVWLAPDAARRRRPRRSGSRWARCSSCIVCASLGPGASSSTSGPGIRDRITWQPVRAIDAVGGAVLSGSRSWSSPGHSASRYQRVADLRASPRGARLQVLAEVNYVLPDSASSNGSRRSTTSSVRASSRATSSRSRPSGSSTYRPAAPDARRPRRHAAPRRASFKHPQHQPVRPAASRAPASSTRPTA